MRGTVAVAVVTAVVVISGAPSAGPPTNVGWAALTFGDESARVVERVDYAGTVERIGDVVLENGVPASSIESPQVAEVWAIVDATWPENRRADLSQLSVIREGEHGLVGVVHSARDGGWILSIDAADLVHPEIVAETVVHELVHVVTLAPSRFEFGDGSECEGVRIDLGCVRAGTSLARFAARFWPDGAPLDGADDAFVTGYARTAPQEDLAETFTAWVFGWTTPEPANEKVRFVAADAELAALRGDLLAAGVPAGS